MRSGTGAADVEHTTPRRSLVLATRNAGKLRELRALVESAGWRAVSLEEAGLPESPEEDALEVFDTFAENARAKASYFAARSGGRIVLAEDSGLCVTALGGGPGVRSKRWAAAPGLSGSALDAANRARLLTALTDVSDRRAAFVCAAVLQWPGGLVEAMGETTGVIEREPCGASGFGYDPVFHSSELGACFGAVSADRKGSVSHRGRAVTRVLAAFAKDFGGTS